MITLRELATGIGAGALLILLGLIPSLFQSLVEGVRAASDEVSSAFSGQHRYAAEIRTPRAWLIGSGIALMFISVLGYTS